MGGAGRGSEGYMNSRPEWTPGQVLSPEHLTPAVIAAIKGTLFPPQIVALTAWAEARSRYESGRGWIANPIDAMADIVNVIDNRAHDPRWEFKGHVGICLQRWQFSCWEPKGGPDDPTDPDDLAENFEALMERAQWLVAGKDPSPKLGACLSVAEAFIDGRHENMLGEGVTHYYAAWLPKIPFWAIHLSSEFVCERYGHRFYRNVP